MPTLNAPLADARAQVRRQQHSALQIQRIRRGSFTRKSLHLPGRSGQTGSVLATAGVAPAPVSASASASASASQVDGTPRAAAGTHGRGGGAARREEAAAGGRKGAPSRRGLRRDVAEVAEEEESHEWTASQWLQSLGLHEVLITAFTLPEPGARQFNYVRKLTKPEIEEMLSKAQVLAGLVDAIHEGVERLGSGRGGLQDGSISSDKFQTNAKFQMSCESPEGAPATISLARAATVSLAQGPSCAPPRAAPRPELRPAPSCAPPRAAPRPELRSQTARSRSSTAGSSRCSARPRWCEMHMHGCTCTCIGARPAQDGAGARAGEGGACTIPRTPCTIPYSHAHAWVHMHGCTCMGAHAHAQVRGSLELAMEGEHTSEKDSAVPFSTTNGVDTKSHVEWEFVVSPQPTQPYPERRGFHTEHPEWCRRPRGIGSMLEAMEVQCNERLRKAGHSELIREELIGGRLCAFTRAAPCMPVSRPVGPAPYGLPCRPRARLRYRADVHEVQHGAPLQVEGRVPGAAG